ncbi:MAG: glycoside hydrolase family 25 protein [Actinobacteria bacterium]|nr:glycoside hydrolase family 25 protein [Actinomycetota bacterium]
MKKLTALSVFLLSIACLLTFAGQAMAEMQGIDVSRWQGTIDWDTTYNYTNFAFIKAGGSDEGMYTDSQFERNRDEARRVGIPRGYYYYAGGGDPIQEAEHFASLVADLQPGEILAIDLEIDHPDPVAYAWTFLVRTEHLTGSKPLLYTNMNRVWGYDWHAVVENGNHLWGAIYDGNPQVMPDPGPWPAVAVKQYTSEGTLPGINSNVDLNIFPSVIDDFKAMGQIKPALPIVEKLEPAAPAAIEPQPPVMVEPEAGNWKTDIQVVEVIEPERLVGIVPAERPAAGETEILTIQWPARRPVIETSFEMDFAAALDS